MVVTMLKFELKWKMYHVITPIRVIAPSSTLTLTSHMQRLPSDILDRILILLPDFETLQVALLTSRAFYEVFQAHPQSIVRAVAYDQVGPALPQALRVVRCQSDKIEYDTHLERDVLSQMITPGETRELILNSDIVHALEDMFSLRCGFRFIFIGPY